MADAVFRRAADESPERPWSSRPRTRSHERATAPQAREERRSRRHLSPQSPSGQPLFGDASPAPGSATKDDGWKACLGLGRKPDCVERLRGSPRPPTPGRSSSRSVITEDEPGSSWPLRALRTLRERCVEAAKWSERCSALPWERKVAIIISVTGFLLVAVGIVGLIFGAGAASHHGSNHEEAGKEGQLRRSKRSASAPSAFPQCSDVVPCPVDWFDSSSAGGFYCMKTGGCRAFAEGHFPECPSQCQLGGRQTPGASARPSDQPSTSPPAERPDTATGLVIEGGADAGENKPLLPLKLERAGAYDLRVVKGGKLLGCAAPIGLFPGQPKYGCSGDYATAKTCDAAKFRIKDTKYVAAVHEGCETEQGRGTYGYAYDDGVGLKQCAPITKYEWVLCPKGDEGPIQWEAEAGPDDSTKRFRVTNHCDMAVWIQQAGAKEQMLPHDEGTLKIHPHTSHTYSIPNRGLPSTRFLPKTGCDADGNGCDIQSMPPCPPEGCDLPVDTKFESSWGCVHATGIPDQDRKRCALTGQGNPSTYQDWWDGSAVDGWTLPFSVLVDDAGHGLTPDDTSGSPDICGPVVCANLVAEKICPRDEYLTPES